MSSWPTIPAATNPAPERSTIPFCSDISTRSDIAAGLAANISRRLPPSKASGGTRPKRSTHSQARRKIQMIDVGFIGLGIMGRPMAGHLQAAGHRLYLNTRSGVPREMIEKTGIACATAQEVAQHAEIIFTMVPDTPDVDKVLFGENGVAQGLRPGKI